MLKTRPGSILVDGQPLDFSPTSLRALRLRVGLLFQDPDDQLLASRVCDDIALGPRNAGLEAVVVEARVERAASTLGIRELLPAFVDELSLGQKKRVRGAEARHSRGQQKFSQGRNVVQYFWCAWWTVHRDRSLPPAEINFWHKSLGRARKR